jgi:hypothetical protein
MRFSRSPPDGDLFARVGALINSVRPGAYTGFRAKGDAFGITVSESALWLDHVDSIFDALRDLSSVIAEAQASGMRVKFDVAIWPEDRQDRNILCLPMDDQLINRLNQERVEFEVTIYC